MPRMSLPGGRAPMRPPGRRALPRANAPARSWPAGGLRFLWQAFSTGGVHKGVRNAGEPVV